MSDAARKLYDSLQHYSDLQALIDSGEAEGPYLECKAPVSPQLGRDLKGTLAKSLSGFSNTGGGIVIWGISTTKHEHSGLDVLSQIEPIGNCALFKRNLENTIPTLTIPAITVTEHKIIRRNKTETRGVVISYIPQMIGDPIQSILDNHFYFRSGDDFPVAPYEMIRRMFAATSAPDLHILLDNQRVEYKSNGLWQIPLGIYNSSSAIAEHVHATVSIENESACDLIELSNFRDDSKLNPGRRVFMYDQVGVTHRGLTSVIGTLHIRMKTEKRRRRLLKFYIDLFANNMRARRTNISVHLVSQGVSRVSLYEQNLY